LLGTGWNIQESIIPSLPAVKSVAETHPAVTKPKVSPKGYGVVRVGGVDEKRLFVLKLSGVIAVNLDIVDIQDKPGIIRRIGVRVFDLRERKRPGQVDVMDI
jgi:hypothetical protein